MCSKVILNIINKTVIKTTLKGIRSYDPRNLLAYETVIWNLLRNELTDMPHSYV